MSNKNELTAKSKGNFTLSGKKPTNGPNKRYRLLSMNDSLLNTVVNNSMEERKNAKDTNLSNSKINNHQTNLNNTVNSDSKKIKISSLPSELKATLRAVYPISSKNSVGKRNNNAPNGNGNDIPIPKIKNQSKISNGEKINNDNCNVILRAKLNSSILFNVKDYKIKESYINNHSNGNNNMQTSNSEKDKLLEYYNNTNGSVTNNTNNAVPNGYSGNSRNSRSKDKNKVENKMKIHSNNILEHKAVNFTHGSIPNNTITNPSFKKTIASENSTNNHNSNHCNNNSPREKSKKNFTLNPISSYNLNMKIVDELSAYKLKNTKLENEILLLNEKIKSLNQTQIFFSNENDILKSKLTDLQEDYKRDLENTKKYKNEKNQLKIINMKFNQNIKSSINTLLEIIELFLSPRSNNPKQSLLYNDNNSYSIDIYDSYNNEEERRNVVFDQIQNLLISKFNIMKKILNVNFDAEIEKVKNWSTAFNVNKSNNNDINVSNIKLSVKNYESSSYESSKKNSQDFFDLSISNQFYIKNNSPKFNNSFGIENENASEKLIKLNTNWNKGSHSNIIGTNAFNTNNFLSAGNLSLNNLNRINSNANNNSFNNANILGTNSDGNHNTNGNSCNNAQGKDCNASINNINNLSLSNMNSNLNNEININNNNTAGGKENNNDEKMININLNFNDSFLKDLNSAQYDSFNDNKGKFETQPNEENIRLNQQEMIPDNLSNNEEININIEDCSIININAENKDNTNNQNINKMFSFDLNDDQCDFNNDFNVAIGTNPINIKETIENEINEKENQNLSFRENNSPKGVKEFVILPPTIINTK